MGNKSMPIMALSKITISEFILLALFCSTFLSNHRQHSCDKIPWSKIIYKTKVFTGLQLSE